MLRHVRCRNVAGAVCKTTLDVVLAMGFLAGCAETTLNEAPIVDRSSRAPAASVASVSTSRQDTGNPPGQESVPAFYTVQKGDTLYHIGVVFHCSVQELARWNGIEENAPLTVGQRLRVRALVAAAANLDNRTPSAAAAAAPAEATEAMPAEVHAVPLPQGPAVETRVLESAPVAAAPAPEAGIGATGVSAAPSASAAGAAREGAAAPVSAQAAGGAEQAAAGAPAGLAPETEKPAASAAWLWPVEGRITASFDPVRTKGIEIASSDGAKVVAVADGEVSYTGAPRDYGNLVIVRHPDGLLSVYAHAKSILVTQGQSVKRGQTIAIAGGTNGTQSLHFEARRKGVPVNPLELLPAR